MLPQSKVFKSRGVSRVGGRVALWRAVLKVVETDTDDDTDEIGDNYCFMLPRNRS